MLTTLKKEVKREEENMNITFLLGNGFDMGLGLKTSYENFYDQYCNPLSTDNENIKAFKTTLKKRKLDEERKIVDWSDFEKAFGKHSVTFAIEQKQSYIERFEDFVMQFNAYLENEEEHADFSNTKLIAETMHSAVSSYFHIRQADRDAIQNIYNTADNRRIYNFISFNYTKTVDESARLLKQHLKSDNSRDVGKVLHIHGFIDENMIMGVNDMTQITNEAFANDEEIVREIIKPRQNADVRANYEKQVIDTINKSNIICVYGMSIGETDKKWWAQIAEWLSKNPKRALVILKYDKKYNKKFAFTQNRFIDPVIDKFLELSEMPENIQANIRSQIFVGMNHNIFAMNLRKETLREQIDASIKRVRELENEQYFASVAKQMRMIESNESVFTDAVEAAESANELALL